MNKLYQKLRAMWWVLKTKHFIIVGFDRQDDDARTTELDGDDLDILVTNVEQDKEIDKDE